MSENATRGHHREVQREAAVATQDCTFWRSSEAYLIGNGSTTHSTSKNYKSHTILIFKAIVSATNQMTHDRRKERLYFKFEVSL
jgi:hypothetical protein